MKALVRLGLAVFSMIALGAAQEAGDLRREREVLMERGLWKDAVAFYKEKLSPLSDAESGTDLEKAVSALGRLNDPKAFDPLVEGTIASHPENPEVLLSAARLYVIADKSGGIAGGEFQRGYPADGGLFVDTSYRDRIRIMQLLLRSLEIATVNDQKIRAWKLLSETLNTGESWRLAILTPVDVLPDWTFHGPAGGTEGAPWANDGPVLYDVPAAWASARNDGERWRFALAQLSTFSPRWAAHATMQRARFAESEFGAHTLRSFGGLPDRDPENTKGVMALESLADDEVLARTSDGVRRFKLPADHHFIALYRSILEVPEAGGDAGFALTQVYLGRGQFTKAAAVLEQAIAKFGKGPQDSYQELLDQIKGSWGRFETAATVPAGTKPAIPLVFRNGTAVKLTASPVDMETVLQDTLAYLRSNPRDLEWERINPSYIASRIVSGKQGHYVEPPVAEWVKALEPAAGHRDTRAEIEVPVDKAGAWWITAEMQGGNTFHTLVWIVDTVLVQRDVAGSKQWWVADAASGEPVEEAAIEFFGYWTVARERKSPLERRMDVHTRTFTRTTDKDGRTLLKRGDMEPDHQWMAIARKAGRSTAFFGFQPFPIEEPLFENGNRDLGYGITDRPLYKPGDTIHVKFFMRNVGYFEPDEAKYANRQGTLVLFNGRGEEAVRIADLKTDELGGVEAEAVIPKDAPLGAWQAVFSIGNLISESVAFRVEEFRKPEYEVAVEAPADPIRLGDKFTATVKASYFHGAPVREAEVEVTVKRSSLGERWFPAGRWDWLYGKGAWWPGTDAAWHPGWADWCCKPPVRQWGGRPRWTPEELVLKRTMKIGPDGTAKVEIDTAPAKEIHGDLDARYSIEARVVDASRREERAEGSVIAARKPFEVVVWTDRGFTVPGSEIEARVSASTLAGKPVVEAEGTLKLFKIAVDAGGKVTESEVMSRPLRTGAAGEASQKLQAPEAGQYRLAASLSWKGGEAAEGATVLNVHGPGRAEAADWKFGALELITDRLEYAPGETLKLRVNSDKPDAHVWLFLHVGGASGLEARRVKLDGKSIGIDVPLDLRDMPNMFIEGVSVQGGRIFSASKEVLLPPVNKMIDVNVEAEKVRLGPGGKTSLRVTLKDPEGNPVSGKAVLAVYDKALEAITGGSNVPPIRDGFWNWKNYYYGGRSSCSVPASPGNLVGPRMKDMENLGLSAQGGAGLDYFAAEGGGIVPRKAMAEAPSAAAPADTAVPREAAPPPMAAPRVRKDFADLLKWSGSVVADAEGRAEIPLEFPDNLTTWKARVWVLGSGTRVGEGAAEIITTKDLMVRLQAPRFLVERDQAVLSAIVHNEHEVEKEVTVSLELDGGVLSAEEAKPGTVKIAAKGEARVDWKVKALREGVAKVRMRAVAGDDGDAVERDLPVLVHGMPRQDAWSRVIADGADSAKIEVSVPEQLRPDETRLTVRFSPTIAGAVVDAIPYLAAYPHGCTEQTLNRFVPAVIAVKLLKDMNVNLAEVKLKRTNLNPQEMGDAKARAEEWNQWRTNPVFDEAEIRNMVGAGLEKLKSMQDSDGGWGWFSGFGEKSYAHTTAVVMHGLIVAKAAGTEVDGRMYADGIAWLAAYEKSEIDALKRHDARKKILEEGGTPEPLRLPEKQKADALDAFVRETLGRDGKDSAEMLEYLFRDRIDLPVYGQALLGLELHRLKDAARRDELLAMLSQFVKRDAENQTAYLDLRNGNYWWYWYGSEVEANAWYLKLLSAVKPADADTRGLAKYLVNNRKGGGHWKSTRDTAYAIEAIAEFAKASGETAPEMEVEVLMDRKSLGSAKINRDNLFSFDGTIILAGKAVAPGKHEIEVRRAGGGTVYANVYLEVFSLEDRLRAAGLEVKVSRRISKIIKEDGDGQVPDKTGLVTSQTEERVKREALADGAQVSSGDLVEVELTMESKNDYEYLIFSDAKAAGFEAVEVLSGYTMESGVAAYMEPRDRTVDFFIRFLPRGKHVLRYQLRAEAPGSYKALPSVAEAMYAPELRGNSEDIRLRIRE